MVSSTHAPELAPCAGLEVPYDGVQLDHDDPEPLPDAISLDQTDAGASLDPAHQKGRKWTLWQRWTIIIGVTLIVIAAIVGAVVATRPRHSLRLSVYSCKKNQLTFSSCFSASMGPPVINSTSESSQRMRLNTSIASTTCPNGDRWVFVQDQRNSIRAARRTSQSSVWQITPNMTIPSTAKPGSPLGASCVQVPEDIGEDFLPGLLVRYCSILSLAFLPNSLAILGVLQ